MPLTLALGAMVGAKAAAGGRGVGPPVSGGHLYGHPYARGARWGKLSSQAHRRDSPWPHGHVCVGEWIPVPVCPDTETPVICHPLNWPSQGPRGFGEGQVPRQVQDGIRQREPALHGGGDRTVPHRRKGRQTPVWTQDRQYHGEAVGMGPGEPRQP